MATPGRYLIAVLEDSLLDRMSPVSPGARLSVRQCGTCPLPLGLLSATGCPASLQILPSRGHALILPTGSCTAEKGAPSWSYCSPCPPGQYCQQPGSQLPSGLCSHGYYCPGSSSTSTPQASPRQAHCLYNLATEHEQCTWGYNCTFTFGITEGGTVTPQNITDATCAGFQGDICPKDSMGGSAEQDCLPCPHGHYCAQSGLAQPSGLCAPGYYCPEGQRTARPPEHVCGAGRFCVKGSPGEMLCGPGSYQASKGQSACDVCPAGYFCPEQGFYCPPGTANQHPCPPGSYGNHSGLTEASDCTPCVPGMYCKGSGWFQAQEGQTKCQPCPPGHHCPGSTTAPLLCPAGHFCQRGISPCPRGYYSPARGLTSAASQVSNPTDNLTGSACPPGTYCQLGVVAGMFSTQLGNRHQEDCAPCPAGSICQAGGAALPCPPGTVRADPGASSQEDCQPCPAGMFCALRGQAMPTGPCQSGYYCSGGARSANSTGNSVTPAGTDLCPPGHYCPTGSPHPVPCPPGSYSSSPGLSREEQCQLCPSGFFCDRPGLVDVSEAVLCDAGYVCLGGSVGPRPTDGRQGYLCPSGYSCPLGTPLEVPCEPGSFSPAPGLARCLTCPAGTVCGSPGTRLPTPCPAGHYCPSGTASALPCPSGTTSRWTGAPHSSTCVPCPTGLYCRSPGSSEPQDQCQQGYFCHGGASSPAPESSASFPGNGPCPLGHYCPAGTLTPVACPAGSIRNLTGGSSLESCMPCPPGYYCASEGQHSPSGPCSAGFYCPMGYSSVSPEALPCPQGHYCPEGIAFALPCPAGTYQPNPTSDSCSTCPHRFYCPTAITEDPLPCPPHSYCPAGTEVPQLCPNGTFTPPGLGGLQDDDECLPCPPGRFCRVGRIQGLCAAGYLCISGSSEFAPQGAPPRDCQGEVECAGPCPAGHYCEEGAEEPRPCPPHTLRTFPGASSRQHCLSCPPQHWCREGDPTQYPCPAGHYCDGLPGSDGQEGAGPKECPTYTYRSTPRAGSKGECQPCPPGYLCNSTGSVAEIPCIAGFFCGPVTGEPMECPAGYFCPEGSDSYAKTEQVCRFPFYCPPRSPLARLCDGGFWPLNTSGLRTSRDASCAPWAASCTCFGQNRAFQHSDGSCLCLTGFVFYNTLDHRISESDNLLNCQPEVNERCATGQARLATTRECVTLSLDLCDATCGSQGGTLDVQLGICRCEHYVSTEELCNASCISKLPHVSARPAVDGQLVLMLGGRDGRRSRTMMIQNILGPDVHMKATGNVYFAQFDADGVFGWILTNEKLIDTLLSGSVKNVYRESSWRIDTKFGGLSPSSHLPRVPNPLTCLSPNDMLVFQLTVTYSDRHLSHFPVYQKDHLFSTNPAWDFGAFRRLGQLIKHSRFNITWFAHVFSEPGTYVFLDNGMPAWSLLVVVSDRGVECDPVPFRPSSPEQLVRLGVKWQRRPNLLPDRATIAGVLGSVGLLIAVLIASALFLDFRRRGMIVLAQYKPRWRSLGEPRLHAEYSQRGPALLGCRGAAEGAEAEETLISRGGYKVGRLDLEEFNVRTLYDKLEDQSLHLASQLACYRKETQEFYKNIQQQAEALKDLIINMDAVKVGHMKDMLALNTACSDPGGDWTAERDGPAHGEEMEDPAVPVLGVFLRALGALLSRDTGECWPQQDAALHIGGSAVHVRSTQDLHNPLQLSVTNMTGHKPAEEMKPDSANLTCTAPCLSENDLSRFVALTPLSRTLQEIQESLQNLPRPEKDTSDDSVESPKGRLVPWALDRLSPQHFAVFLFGCDIVRRLCDSHGFPRVTLLLAQTVPISCRPGPQGPCFPDFHYDPDNQILYLCKATLEDVGQFTATLLHSMAYVGSADSTSSFMESLHRAVSALGLPLFYASFTKRHDHTEGETEEGAIGSVFDDILSLTIPVETHFTEQLLAERLQKFKYFQLRQHLRDLKTQATNGVGDEPGPKGPEIQEQECNVEQEIDRLNSLFLYLSARLLEGGEISRRTQEQEEAGKNPRQAGGPFWAGAESGLSRGSTLLLTLRRHCVARRLSDMHRRLTQIRLSQDSTLQHRGQEAGSTKAGGHRPGLQASSHATSELHASHDPMQELQIPGDPTQELQSGGQHNRVAPDS
ncbi:uncharacterized protein [Paramormyrops kingsleyae]|uniref:uncharacterized protein n=1 Tax=Paramormyrops kingsleyae TaxID=1676925 RepID=UPI003B97912B